MEDKGPGIEAGFKTGFTLRYFSCGCRIYTEAAALPPQRGRNLTLIYRGLDFFSSIVRLRAFLIFLQFFLCSCRFIGFFYEGTCRVAFLV